MRCREKQNFTKMRPDIFHLIKRFDAGATVALAGFLVSKLHLGTR